PLSRPPGIAGKSDISNVAPHAYLHCLVIWRASRSNLQPLAKNKTTKTDKRESGTMSPDSTSLGIACSRAPIAIAVSAKPKSHRKGITIQAGAEMLSDEW